MFRRFTKKRSLALSGLLLLLLASGAVAYFTASGSGTGTATVGTSSGLTIHGSSGSTLYPGTTSTISFTVDNPSSGRQQLGTIHLASVETGASDGTTANFWMADVVSGQDVGNGNLQSVTATGTLKMNDLNSNQDACENANLTLNFTS